MMNIFERAIRAKLRFNSRVGELTTEQLWDLPLTARGNGVSLDGLAKAVNKELKASEEESFVETPSKADSEMQLRLDILKHVIADKLARKEAAAKKAEKAAQKDTLLRLLEKKQQEALEGLSAEEIQAKLAELDN
ncbi:hypothetical protein KNU84_gp031 [Bacteriophage DSS3_VP1]|uniref:Uncharacterized protein n=1 Tax=Bacteriophage DSS3_VP1 TaxID=2664196 RepID=A0A7S5KQD5_9CAUD|nr:hypothetical protein KNU84_gp031 [Bacteriophage DSS3_VP1]QGH74673.1 hypothetical protein DSS3VP1_00105 [Bacteriophage DSS3_VP1]